jgi:hypothetical protein
MFYLPYSVDPELLQHIKQPLLIDSVRLFPQLDVKEPNRLHTIHLVFSYKNNVVVGGMA